MNTTNMLVEFLIIGLFVLLALVFTYAIIFGVRTIDVQWAYVKDYIPLIVVLFLMTDYLLGVVAYEFVNIVARPFRWLVEKTRLMKFATGTGRTNAHAGILQYGSEQLLRRYEFNVTLLRIYKNLSFFTPVLGTLVVVWGALGRLVDVVVIGTIVTVVMTIVLCASFFHRRGIQERFFEACTKIAKRGPSANGGASAGRKSGR